MFQKIDLAASFLWHFLGAKTLISSTTFNQNFVQVVHVWQQKHDLRSSISKVDHCRRSPQAKWSSKKVTMEMSVEARKNCDEFILKFEVL